MSAITFNRELCADFAAKILGCEKRWGDWFQVVGLERDGQIVATAIYNDMTDHNIEMTIAAIPGKRWATRKAIRSAFRYPFVQLKVKRVTAHIRQSNADAIRAARHFGFVQEGVARQWFGNEDAIVFGMLKSECKYI